MVLYVTAQAWTHVEVVRQLDLLIPKTAPESVARRILSRFRSIYFRHCDDIFYQFSECIQDGGAQWILMKKPDLADPILQHLTAMLSDCMCGLLNIATSKAK